MAFIVMVYKDPSQVERFIRRMNHPSLDFYIHVDKKIDIEPFLYLKNLRNVYFVEHRWEIIWASFRFTWALIQCVKQALDSGRKYDFVGSFSSQDYPIQPVEVIVDYYSSRLSYSFFSIEENDSFWWSHAITRINKYHLTNYKFPGRYKIQYLLNKILPQRTFPFFKELYGGPRATWWTMSVDCANYVVEYLINNKKLQKFAKYTWGCDEFLIQTIVMNSKHKGKVINDSGRYIDWSKGGSNPKILTDEDFDKITSSNKLFARKFDIKVDTKILDRIDASIDRQYADK